MSTTITKVDIKRRGYVGLRCVKIEVSEGETGDPVAVDGFPFTVTCLPSEGSPAGSGKIQFSTSLPAEVKAGTAKWQDWARGVVTSMASDIPEGPVTAIRGVAIVGDLVIELVQ